MLPQKRWILFDDAILDSVDLARSRYVAENMSPLPAHKVTPRFRNGDALYKSTDNVDQERLRLLLILAWLICHFISFGAITVLRGIKQLETEEFDDIGSVQMARVVLKLKEVMQILIDNGYEVSMLILEGMEIQHESDKMALALFQNYIDSEVSSKALENAKLEEFKTFIDSI
jgi:hypothetical protein